MVGGCLFIIKLPGEAAQDGEQVIHLHSALTQAHAAHGAIHHICPLGSGQSVTNRCDQPGTGGQRDPAKPGSKCFFHTKGQCVRCQGVEIVGVTLA